MPTSTSTGPGWSPAARPSRPTATRWSESSVGTATGIAEHPEVDLSGRPHRNRHDVDGGHTMEFGYFLSSEEYGPRDLVDQAVRAETAGWKELLISDHFHPWVEQQGHSPFVWGVIGAIAGATDEVTVTTGVTCPTVRTHPAVIAQAAATASLLLDGRFRFGVGSGENLNEHILGDDWPETDVRLEMLEEAVEVIRALWQGQQVSHRGTHYTVRNARLYDAPTEPPAVIVSGFGPKSASLAGRI